MVGAVVDQGSSAGWRRHCDTIDATTLATPRILPAGFSTTM
jgi:hypothetical protein